MKKTIAMMLVIAAGLSGCGDPYEERTTPINCACGDWETPLNNKGVA